ncbi:hypothetical protein H2248_010860 [Termitomyces sp. 'cryptogamus']|nr:hypothetical protein H2248_010860 [Termitomyces sp. 'cryptogamus']
MRLRRFFRKISRCLKPPFAVASQRKLHLETVSAADRPARLVPKLNLDHARLKFAVNPVLLMTSTSPKKTCFIDDHNTKNKNTKMKRTLAFSIRCSAYAARLSFLRPETNVDDIVGILGYLLRISPCSCPVHISQRFFRDLCLLARSNNVSVREMALRLVVLQIKNSNISPLVKVLLSRFQKDISLSALLTDLMSCLPDYWMETQRFDLHRAIQSVWSLDLHLSAIRRVHAAMPFAEFCYQLIQSRQSVARIVVGAGYIDMIIKMCKTNFPDSRIPTADTLRWNATSSLTTLFALTLKRLSQYPGIQTSMKWEALAQCWPTPSSRINTLIFPWTFRASNSIA